MVVEATESRTRTEDFPIEIFRFLEKKISLIRREVMYRAAKLAAIEQPEGDVYKVSNEHVDKAFQNLDIQSIFEQ